MTAAPNQQQTDSTVGGATHEPTPGNMVGRNVLKFLGYGFLLCFLLLLIGGPEAESVFRVLTGWIWFLASSQQQMNAPGAESGLVNIRGRCGVRSVKRRLWLLLLVRGSQIGDSGGCAGQMRWIRKYWRPMDGSSYRASLRDEFPTDSRAGSRQDCREFFHRLPRTLRNTSSTTFAD